MGTRFRLESLDEEDAFYDEPELIGMEFGLIKNNCFAVKGRSWLYLAGELPNTTFTLIP